MFDSRKLLDAMAGAPNLGDGVLSHTEIGRRLGLSKSRVQQIEAAALQKMRRALVERGLFEARQLPPEPAVDPGECVRCHMRNPEPEFVNARGHRCTACRKCREWNREWKRRNGGRRVANREGA